MRVRKLTPVLYVEEIEPCLDFWYRLGFEKTAEVPEGDRLGFAILKKDVVKIMYQTRASVGNDIPVLKEAPAKGSFLFIEVDDVDEIDRLLGGANYVIPRRKTFYGADEVIVREPSGNVVAFAQFGAVD
jgi:uncharacterized glyoxalase superfamily protein PhnB